MAAFIETVCEALAPRLGPTGHVMSRERTAPTRRRSGCRSVIAVVVPSAPRCAELSPPHARAALRGLLGRAAAPSGAPLRVRAAPSARAPRVRALSAWAPALHGRAQPGALRGRPSDRHPRAEIRREETGGAAAGGGAFGPTRRRRPAAGQRLLVPCRSIPRRRSAVHRPSRGRGAARRVAGPVRPEPGAANTIQGWSPAASGAQLGDRSRCAAVLFRPGRGPRGDVFTTVATGSRPARC